MTGRSLAAACVSLAIVATVPEPTAAAGAIPVRVRIIKGARQGPPAVDPRLADVAPQLGRTAYQRWDEVWQHQVEMASGKPVQMSLPYGAMLELTLVDARKDDVTFEVRVAAHHTHSRLTISKSKRIVHQVTDEKNGEAYFVTVKPWP